MAGKSKFEYAGAFYHVMARSNGGDKVFVSQDGRHFFSPLEKFMQPSSSFSNLC
jgi:phosphatidate phosphatase APP1